MAEQGAVSDNDIAMERREAQGSSQGPARLGTPTPLNTWVPEARREGRPIARPARGASQAPWRLPALHSLIRGKKENGMQAHPGPEIKQQGRRSVG